MAKTKMKEIPAEVRAGFWARIDPKTKKDELEDYAGREVQLMIVPQVLLTGDELVERSSVAGKQILVVPDNASITVKTRDAASATLIVTLDDLVDVVGSRVELPNAG